MLPSQTINKIFAIFQKRDPNPTTELQYKTPFELLIAVMLSAQATDKGVNLATAKLFPIASTPSAILALGEEGLKPYLKTINYFNTKTKNIVKACEMLVNQFNSQVPHDRQSLESLPGVGRKTANVLLNTLFDEITIAVDTHIFRVAHRLHLSKGKTPEKVEQDLLKVIPKKYLKNAHHWLVLHGRYVCIARKPKCLSCPIATYCPSFHLFFT